jgi:hypothetical protein
MQGANNGTDFLPYPAVFAGVSQEPPCLSGVAAGFEPENGAIPFDGAWRFVR